jgi:LacI family transcriptional regulator
VRVDRLAGYFSALAAHGIEFDPALVTESRPSLTSGVSDVHAVMRVDARPTAMLCYNDYVAMGVMHALRGVGLTPGVDMAVVGFDGMPETEITYPPLSTVQLYGSKVGSDAAELLIARISDPSRAPTRRVEQATLLIRASSARE